MAESHLEGQKQLQISPVFQREDMSAPQLPMVNPHFTLAPPSHQPQPWQRLRVPWERLAP